MALWETGASSLFHDSAFYFLLSAGGGGVNRSGSCTVAQVETLHLRCTVLRTARNKETGKTCQILPWSRRNVEFTWNWESAMKSDSDSPFSKNTRLWTLCHLKRQLFPYSFLLCCSKLPPNWPCCVLIFLNMSPSPCQPTDPVLWDSRRQICLRLLL